jgi:hypothetical protein
MNRFSTASPVRKLSIMAGIIAAIAAANNAFAGTVKVKGSEAGTSVSVNFSFNGVTPANYSVFSGSDNIGDLLVASKLPIFLLALEAAPRLMAARVRRPFLSSRPRSILTAKANYTPRRSVRRPAADV